MYIFLVASVFNVMRYWSVLALSLSGLPLTTFLLRPQKLKFCFDYFEGHALHQTLPPVANQTASDFHKLLWLHNVVLLKHSEKNSPRVSHQLSQLFLNNICQSDAASHREWIHKRFIRDLILLISKKFWMSIFF